MDIRKKTYVRVALSYVLIYSSMIMGKMMFASAGIIHAPFLFGAAIVAIIPTILLWMVWNLEIRLDQPRASKRKNTQENWPEHDATNHDDNRWQRLRYDDGDDHHEESIVNAMSDTLNHEKYRSAN